MGLDMYLKAQWYLSQFDETEKKIAESVNEIVGLEKMPGRKNVIESEAIYWRKANAIHKWFVDNVQDGNDDCGTHFVSRDALVKLYRICREVILKPSDAEKLLPTEDGFFFGSTDYDDYYMSDVDRKSTRLNSSH